MVLFLHTVVVVDWACWALALEDLLHGRYYRKTRCSPCVTRSHYTHISTRMSFRFDDSTNTSTLNNKMCLWFMDLSMQKEIRIRAFVSITEAHECWLERNTREIFTRSFIHWWPVPPLNTLLISDGGQNKYFSTARLKCLTQSETRVNLEIV